MVGINLLAVVVAAVAAFFSSFVWYMIFGKELAKVSPAFAELQAQRPQPQNMLVVIIGSLVLAFVIAYLLRRMDIHYWFGGVLLGGLLWIGLSAVQWASSIVWEKVPLKLAAIHAGDWLVKLVLIGAIIAAWQ